MNRAAILVALLLLAACVHDVRSDDRLARSIEASVTLPASAFALTSYRRYYAWVDGKRDTVEAVYDRSGPPKRLWLPHDELPIILDGGCSVVHFNYEVVSRTVHELRCN